MHICLLAYGNYLCYISRNVPTDFAEGKYITFAMANNLHTTMFALVVAAL